MTAERFRTRAGSVLHVEDTGSGPAVVALHGLGGGAWFFSGFARRLSSEYRILSFDHAGTGRSVAAAEPSIALWVADCCDLVRDRIGGPAVILGHSLGTILALHAAAACPEQIRALILVGGLPEPRALIKERLTERAAAVARSGLAGSGSQVAAANFAGATLARQPELVGMFERLFEAQDPAGYVRACHVLIGATAMAALRDVRVPCLSITGAEDQYAPPDLVADFMRRVPGAREQQVMPDCGHLPFLEAPAAFAAAVKSFLATLC